MHPNYAGHVRVQLQFWQHYVTLRGTKFNSMHDMETFMTLLTLLCGVEDIDVRKQAASWASSSPLDAVRDAAREMEDGKGYMQEILQRKCTSGKHIPKIWLFPDPLHYLSILLHASLPFVISLIVNFNAVPVIQLLA